jgi:hypothetical protein
VRAQLAHQLGGVFEAREVADLGAQPDLRQRVDGAQAAQLRDGAASWARAPRSLLRGRRGAQERVDRAEVSPAV